MAFLPNNRKVSAHLWTVSALGAYCSATVIYDLKDSFSERVEMSMALKKVIVSESHPLNNAIVAERQWRSEPKHSVNRKRDANIRNKDRREISNIN